MWDEEGTVFLGGLEEEPGAASKHWQLPVSVCGDSEIMPSLQAPPVTARAQSAQSPDLH